MTITQFAILRHLAREAGIPLSRLAEMLVMERTSLYRTLEPIERRGWVMITAGRSARAKSAALTDAGRRAMAAATPAWEAAQDEIVTALGSTDLRALDVQLRILAATSGDGVS